MRQIRSWPVRRAIVSHALAALSMSLPWPLLILLVWESTGDDVAVGLTGAARMLPYVALSWYVGRLADRHQRDRVVRLTLAARVVLLAIAAGALAADLVPAAVVATTLAVASATPAFPALAAAMPHAAGADTRRATDLLVTVEVASFVVGPAIGGVMLQPGLRSWVAPLSAALAAAALALFAGIRLPRPAAEEGEEAGTGIGSVLLDSAAVRGAIGIVMVINAVLAGAGFALLALSDQMWRDGGAGYGLATGALGFGALAAPLMRGGNTQQARARIGLLVLGVGLMLVVPTPGVWWAVAPLLLAGAANVYAEGAATAIMQDNTPDDLRAGILGVADTAMISAALVASLVTPWLAHALGGVGLLVLLAVSAAGACKLARPGSSAEDVLERAEVPVLVGETPTLRPGDR